MAGGVAGVLLRGVDGTLAGLAKAVPPAVITVWAFWGVVILGAAALPEATVMACRATSSQGENHQQNNVT